MNVLERAIINEPVTLAHVHALVIGGDGLIGSALRQRLRAAGVLAGYTSRRVQQPLEANGWHLDLHEDDDSIVLPEADIVFLCAGITGFRECEGNQEAWRTNVDGVLRVASLYPFAVYPSSEAVEWSGNQYARQHAQVEAVLLARGNAAIVRCGRVSRDSAALCASRLLEIGGRRKPGVYRWPG